MIPADLYEIPTLAAVLEARGETPAAIYQCPTCPRALPPENLVWTEGLPGTLPAFVCHTCASAPHRLYCAEIAAAERIAAGYDWSAVRAQRNAILRSSDWTQGVSDAPLSPERREAWRLYREALRNITDTSPSPSAVVWPSAPA